MPAESATRRHFRGSPTPIFAAALVVAVAPIVGQLGRVLRSSYIPSTDDAIIAVKAHEVFTRHPPLLGMSSAIRGIVGGEAIPYHLGPMLFWALAIPERFMGYRTGLPIGSAIVNIAAAIAFVMLLRRAAGDRVALAGATVLAIMVWSVGRGVLAEPWNPFIAIVPFALVLASAWSLANGVAWAFPILVVASSFVVQSHYVFALPVFGACLAAFGGLALRRHGDRGFAPSSTSRAPWITGLVVAALCWIPTIYQQLRNDPGNITVLADSGRAVAARLEPASVWRLIANTVGAIPIAARGPMSDSSYVNMFNQLSALTAMAAAAVIMWLLAGTVIAWRRAKLRAARCGILALAVVGATWLTLLSLPGEFPAVRRYLTMFLWPVSALVWCAVGALVAVTLPESVVARVRGRWLLGVAAIAVVLAFVGATPATLFDEVDYRATAALGSPTVRALDAHETYLVLGLGTRGSFVQYGVMRALFDADIDFAVPNNSPHFVPRRAVGDRKLNTIVVMSGPGRVPTGARVLARFDGGSSPDTDFVVYALRRR